MSRDKDVKLDALNVSAGVFFPPVKLEFATLLIMCVTERLLTPFFVLFVCLCVQTGNQHIYQPVGKAGNGF